MSYEVSTFGARTLFLLLDEELTYEKITEAIDAVIQPEEKSEEEITSFTQAFVFTKGQLSVYFEHFHAYDCYFSFELYPLETNDPLKIAALHTLVDKLDKFLYAR